MIESSRRFWESRVRTMAGILSSPAILLARQRRSPATILYLPSSLVTTIGCNTPCSLIEAANALIASSSKSRRGWFSSRTISEILSFFSSLVFLSSSAVGSNSSSISSVGMSDSNPRPRPFPKLILFLPPLLLQILYRL